MTVPEIRTIEDWHEALNNGAVDNLLALSHPDVEMGGPRGTVHGTQLLRGWVDHIRLEPRRTLHRADTVIVEQSAEWRSAETGEVTGGQTVASVFVVRDGEVTSVQRYDALADALAYREPRRAT